MHRLAVMLGAVLLGLVVVGSQNTGAGAALAVAAKNGSFGQAKIAGITVGPPQYVMPPASSGLGYINAYGDLASLSDEHPTILPPGTVPGHENDYLFVVPPGVTVLTGGSGPDSNGVWTLDFALDYLPRSPGPDPTVGPIFLAPFDHSQCPAIDDQHPQDSTPDLNYAAPGSLVVDPTRARSKGMLLIYEGTTRCLNVDGGATQNDANGFYATLMVATSEQFGRLWPVYRNNFTPLPFQSTTWGPQAPASGAFGELVCVANNCDRMPSPDFGRYPVVSPPYSIADVVASGQPLSKGMGEQAPAAFVDGGYVYVVHNFGCPRDFLACRTSASADGMLTMARARLSGDDPLFFEKWTNGKFSEPGDGIGGEESAVFPVSASSTAYSSCQDPNQSQAMGSLSYLRSTHEYLLTFVCDSPADPANWSGSPPPPDPNADPQYVRKGSAWFYSTLDADQYDLSNQDKWSTPVEIVNSWQWHDSNHHYQSGRTPYCVYDGWYPSFMSLGALAGHLATTGYAFSMDGCTDGDAGRPRYFRSRVFNISLTTSSMTGVSTNSDRRSR